MLEAANADARRHRQTPLHEPVRAGALPDAAEVAAAMARLAPLYARFGLQPEPPARWCEDFAMQFEALIQARPAVASFTFGILSSAQVRRIRWMPAATSSARPPRRPRPRPGRRWAPTPWSPAAWRPAGTAAPSGRLGGQPDRHLALVPACVDAQDIPVIAAGGIMDGRGIAAAQALERAGGADGHGLPGLPESAITPPSAPPWPARRPATRA